VATIREAGPGDPVPAGPTAAAAGQVSRRTWLATIVLLIAAFMELMDVTMANVAIPSIQADLGASEQQIQWVVAGYAVAFAVALLTGGRLGDIYGRKRMFVIGLVTFMVTSLLCGVAPNAEALVASRVLQGIAAAIMLPQVLASISVWFPAERRKEAFGLFGAVSGIGGLAAPLIGGALIKADIFGWDWRPIFLINLVIGTGALIATLALVDESKSPQPLKLDPLGVLVGGAAVFLVVYPVIQGREADWAPWVWVMLAASVPVGALFVLVERRKTRRDNSPLVDLGLFAERGFPAGLLVTLVFFAGVTAIAFLLMIFLQSGFGYDALGAGLALLPLPAGLVLGAGLSVPLSQQLGRGVLQVGSLIAAGGSLWLGAAIDGNITLNAWDIAPALALIGLGLGITVAPLNDYVLGHAAEESAGSASGLQSTMIQIGNAVGVAVLGVIFFDLLGEDLTAPARATFAAAMHETLYWEAGVFLLTALIVFLIPGGRRAATGPAPLDPAGPVP
jgi:EmrB/QacA subfamily drug resistance transporter